MTFAAPSIGTLGQFGWDTANPVTAAYEYTRFDVQPRQQYIDPDGIRGTLDRQSENVAAGIIPVEGTVSVKPTYALLSGIALKAILGGTPTGVGTMTYPLANGNIDTYMTIDRIAKVDTYGLLWVDRATFSSEEGRELELELDVFGQTETEGLAASFPAGLVPAYQPPFVHSAAGTSFTCISVARQIKRISVAIANNYTKDRYFNSQTIATPGKQSLDVDITLTVPYTSDNTDIYALATAGSSGGVAVWSDGTHSLTMTFGNVQLNGAPSKPIQGKTETLMDIPLKARRLTTTRAIVVTL